MVLTVACFVLSFIQSSICGQELLGQLSRPELQLLRGKQSTLGFDGSLLSLSVGLSAQLGPIEGLLERYANGSFVRPIPASAANYATLREIEGRLKSIRNIEKITKTMKIVASTKLSRAQRAMTESRSYGQTSNTVFEQAETKALEDEGKKTLIVVASSDKGLCGGIHSGLSKKTRRMLEENPNADLAVIGEKSKAQLSRSSGKKIQLSFAGVGKNVPTFADAQAIADQISLLPTDYSNVQIIYNKFINAQSYEATPIEAFSEEAIKNSRMFQVRRG